eukprot:NODE_67_length_23829_cov_0.557059.p20 type:complete len:103 gc:universal NODE_67_length_23829_cov_0.557059:2695-2387(-)
MLAPWYKPTEFSKRLNNKISETDRANNSNNLSVFCSSPCSLPSLPSTSQTMTCFSSFIYLSSTTPFVVCFLVACITSNCKLNISFNKVDLPLLWLPTILNKE